jgi:hypothetical protein
LIIDFGEAAVHAAHVKYLSMKATMKALHRTLTASAVAFSAFAFIALAAPCAQAQPMRSGTYCLSYGEGGTDCSFTSYAQCEATASGLTAECFGPPFRTRAAIRVLPAKPARTGIEIECRYRKTDRSGSSRCGYLTPSPDQGNRSPPGNPVPKKSPAGSRAI